MTNLELGKQIYDVVRTELDFETWYKDCFGACVESAANIILNGHCDYNKGSVLEVSRTESKDGNTHNFDFDKENFVEYYGEEYCFKTFTTAEDVVNDLINYTAGSGKSEYYNEEQSQLFAEFDAEWESLPCDPEGANAEQKAQQDSLLDEYASKILAEM